MSTIIKKLEQHQPATPSRWREKAEFRQAHKKLLRTLQQQKMQLLDEIENARDPGTLPIRTVQHAGPFL
jgi:hypothetical protein